MYVPSEGWVQLVRYIVLLVVDVRFSKPDAEIGVGLSREGVVRLQIDACGENRFIGIGLAPGSRRWSLTLHDVKSDEKSDGLGRRIIVAQTVKHVAAASRFARQIARMRPTIHADVSLRI